MMTRYLNIVVLLVCAPAAAAAQVTETSATFEVASVKRADVRSGDRYPASPGLPSPGGRWSAFTTLSTIVRFLYDVRAEQIVGAPSWFDKDVFVINAKAADASASREQLEDMAKRLLAERFKLRLHSEQRPFDVHA